MRQLVAAVTVLAGLAGTVAARSFDAGATVFRVTTTAAAGQQWTPDRPLFLLLLGSDARPGAGCGCSDAIHLVGVPAGGGQATMVNIPRDTRIDVPGFGVGKITEAMSKGGPQATTAAISAFAGVPIAYTIVTGFEGLPAMVDELGGVTVVVQEPVRDSFTNVNVDPGPVAMDGDFALRFARSRHIPGGDFARSQNQGSLILAVLGELRSEGTSPADTIRYLSILARHTELAGMSTADLWRLARVALTIDPANVRNIVLPGSEASIGGVSYVVAGSAAEGLLADLADDGILQSH